MRRLSMVLIAATLAITMLYGNVSAVVIYDNGVPEATNAALTFSDPSYDVYRVADDFVLGGGVSVITDIHWWGGYENGNYQPVSNDFTITIYETSNSAYLPGASVYTSNIGNVVGTYCDITNSWGSDIYYYSIFVEPIILSTGTIYWLEIVNDTADDDVFWGWARTNGEGVFANWGYPDEDVWNGRTLQEMSFNLTNDSASVPEPATMLLVGFGMIGLAGFRRKFKK